MRAELAAALEAHYAEEGWARAEDVFDARQLAELEPALLRIEGREQLSPRSVGALEDTASHEDRRVRKADGPALLDQAFVRFLASGPLRPLVERLLGGPARLAYDRIFFKPPRVGSAEPYHQDDAFFACDPPEGALTAWIALDDADEENGCLHYVGGSHRGPLLPHDVPAPRGYGMIPDPSLPILREAAPAPARRGSVLFHHVRTLHGSPANRSGARRRAYATHWIVRDGLSGELVRRGYAPGRLPL